MIAGLRPYPTMKDSGVPWLGEVPKHWGIERAKWLFRKKDRPVRDSDEVVTCFRDGIVTLRRNRRVLGFTEALKEIGYQGIRRGDLVIHAMDAFAGAIGVADSDGKGTPVYSVCEPAPGANAYYYAYAVREMARSQWIQALAKGIRERSTDFRFGDFGSQSAPLPPLPEQAAIVRFLDHADRRIRRYIRAKQKLIKLLEEPKQAIIHRAVTRGLDPNVRLKPSGVEWLGDVPEHWEVQRTKTLFRLRTETSGVGHGRELLSIYTHIGVRPRKDLDQKGNKASTTDDYWIVRQGDLIANKLLAWMGAIGVSHYDGVTSPAYDILMPVVGLAPDYYHHLFRTKLYLQQFKQRSRGIMEMRLRLYFDQLGQIPVPVPPTDEQWAVVDYYDDATEGTDRTIGQTRREIELLRESRTRLIADVVTGKLDVREAAAGLPDEVEETEPLGEVEAETDEGEETADDLGEVPEEVET